MVCRTDTERASLSPNLSNSHKDTQFLPSFSHVPFPSVSIHHVLFYSQMHCPSLLAGPLFGDWWQLSQRGHVCKDTQGSFLRRAASFFSHGNGTAHQNFYTKPSKTFSHLLSVNLQNYNWIIVNWVMWYCRWIVHFSNIATERSMTLNHVSIILKKRFLPHKSLWNHFCSLM